MCTILLFVVSAFAKAQDCATLTSPNPLPVENELTWTDEGVAGGYTLMITDSGGVMSEIQRTPSQTFYRPAMGWPENETYTIIVGLREDPADPDPTTLCNAQTFTIGSITTLPGCNMITSPLDGTIDVPLTPLITWSYAPRATEYLLNIGTTLGGNDVLANQLITNGGLSFQITTPLAEGTLYYASVTPRNAVGEAVACNNDSTFTTLINASEVPECTMLNSPMNGEDNVAITPLLTWVPVANADGYRLTIGSSPTASDIVDDIDFGNVTSTFVVDFDEGIKYYVTVTPYNTAGDAIDCTQTCFTTTLGCGPYFDPITGETVDLNPQIILEDSYSFCNNDDPLQLSYTGVGEVFSWIQMVNGAALEISSTRNVTITESGTYRLDVITEVPIEEGIITCDSSHTFTVSVSEAPVIEDLNVSIQNLNVSINVAVSGIGDYEYSIVSPDGPYQDSPVFTNLGISDVEVFVRDRNGCGIDSASLNADIDLGFPKYFTPNGDGINDYWQVRGIVVRGETITRIEVYDRYGKRITSFSPRSMGWDGTFNGRRLLDAGFWYKAFTLSNQVLVGHFALRR
ncbi:T9SS type B sorting domain-containing protein [Dokdonia sp.]|uniref:T9SS type B sorting domain-containing protein n=1 Tax=Dokdonia sp. TaxID=2024995 RepID=UPI003264121F